MADGMILVFNAGSSTLKFACFQERSFATTASGLIDWSGGGQIAVLCAEDGKELAREAPAGPGYRSAVRQSLQMLERAGVISDRRAQSKISAVGHRVVHGGSRFDASVAIDREVEEALRELSELAPLHNPSALDAIEAAGEALPAAPQVAVFDTSFFRSLPARAYVYPLPYAWFTEWGIRRFGFHGISHDYCARRAAELAGGRKNLNLVVCHLGNGCSSSAVRDGKAIATTMGFTPLEGLMMGTRAGSIDPGILTYVQRKFGLTAERLDDALNRESGLLGVSGHSGSFREVELAACEGSERARLALDIYCDRVRAAIGSLAVTLGAVDALVFTGGVGENSAGLRSAVCEGLGCLGIHLDADMNRRPGSDRDVAASNSRVRIWIIHTREERLIAGETWAVISARGRGA